MAGTVYIVSRDDDPITSLQPVRWAIGQLVAAIEAKGVRATATAEEPTDQVEVAVLVAGASSPRAEQLLLRAGVVIPPVPEALGLVPVGSGAGQLLLVTGSDQRGLVYGLLELADRVSHAGEPLAAMRLDRPVVQQPANQVRSVGRLFTSELNDKPWFHDKSFWRRYLSMLAAQRFNRLNLMVGLGYNFPWHITDSYLYFAYPFLVDVPGYGVRVPQLPREEREQNLEMMRFISEEAVGRGLDFQFGMWTHAYQWLDSSDAHYTVEGLTPERHAAYCRDAIVALLQACPAIGGLTIRTHGESGIRERSWDFWKVVLQGPVQSGRRVRIDLHSKGLDQETLDIALATNLPLTVSPKYTAEHMGLPYHQSAIRHYDRRPLRAEGDPHSEKDRFMATSEGSRPFTRYGYGDFLREDRPYDVVFRIWPGTQRVLLWGDPRLAAGFGRHASLAGTQGLEWCDPLSLKGREGTGLAGSRDGYADASLSSADDWEKYAYTYRLFGRLTYDPDEQPETWRRYLRSQFGSAAMDVEAALGSASRILPLVTTAHHPSASNNYYWPEIYTDMPIVRKDGSPEPIYYDAPLPKRFGTVSALDPELFASVEAFVDELLTNERSGRYSPLDVAGWLEELATTAERHRARLLAELPDPASPATRRLSVDVAIQAALGRFFAGKLRAAVLHTIAVRTGSRAPLEQALMAYRDARAAWTEAAGCALGVYVDDLTYGPQPWLRGTWSDRLPAIDADLEAMAALVRDTPPGGTVAEADARHLITEAERKQPVVSVSHTAPSLFRRGEPIPIVLEVEPSEVAAVSAVRLRYRPLDQSADYSEVTLDRADHRFVGAIPGHGTETPYPLQYFFILRGGDSSAWLHPGLGEDLSGRPYYVVQADAQATAESARARLAGCPAKRTGDPASC